MVIFLSVSSVSTPRRPSTEAKKRLKYRRCFEAGVEVILIILLLSSFQALLGVLVLLEGDVSIHYTYVMNTVRPLRPEVSLIFSFLYYYFLFIFVTLPFHT